MAILEELLGRVESEWIEYKDSNSSPEIIGKNISAIANSCLHHVRPAGYIIWGVDNQSKAIIGTSFRSESAKVGNQPLLMWLAQQFSPKPELEFEESVIDEKRLMVLRITPPRDSPVSFHGKRYIRIGESPTELSHHPVIEARIWRNLDSLTAETHVIDELNSANLKERLDVSPLQRAFNLNSQDDAIIHLRNRGLLTRGEGDRHRITAAAGLLFSRDLSQFGTLHRKRIRIVRYQHDDRTRTVEEFTPIGGYGLSFQPAFMHLMSRVSSQEVLIHGIRQSSPVIPEIVLRELLSNAVAHQDLTEGRQGPLIKIFDSRIEITSNGPLMVERERLVDRTPDSRNPLLVDTLRDLGICEERGSGWDKIARAVDEYNLPAPEITTSANATTIAALSPRPFSQLSRTKQTETVYLHACITWVNDRAGITNSSVRNRFGVEQSQISVVSRLLRNCVDEGMIKPLDESVGTRSYQYIPFWVHELRDGTPT